MERVKRLKCAFAGAVAVLGLALAIPQPVSAAGGAVEIERQEWTFGGMFGYFDQAQLQRGFKVYYNVCASCHSMNLLYYRNLSQPGGPEFSEEQMKAIAASVEVTAGPNDDGEMFTRPGLPTDRFKAPHENEKAAAAANNGVAPPDLSVIAKARTVERDAAWYMFPVNLISDLATQYQEQGPDYIYALLTGYVDPPEGFQLSPGTHYNRVYPGHQIAMPNILSDDIVEYGDGTPQTAEQYARDVTAFLMWAAEPKLEERKQLGIKVIIYLIILSLLLYLSKRALWRNIEH
jgi:cytochrome c1